MGETVPRAESEHEPTSWSQRYLINVLKTLSAYFPRDSAYTLDSESLELGARGRAGRATGRPPAPRRG